jgi:hypothetical protein
MSNAGANITIRITVSCNDFSHAQETVQVAMHTDVSITVVRDHMTAHAARALPRSNAQAATTAPGTMTVTVSRSLSEVLAVVSVHIPEDASLTEVCDCMKDAAHAVPRTQARPAGWLAQPPQQ